MAESEKSARIYKKVISIVLSFLIFIFLTVTAFLACIYLNIFDPQTIIKSLEKSDYYTKTKTEFETNAWDITIPLGLPQSIVTELALTDKIKSDINDTVKASLNNKDNEIDTQSITTAIDERVKEYFEEDDEELSEDQLKVLEQYKDTVSKEYIKLTNIVFLKYCGNIKTTYSSLILIYIATLLFLSALSLTIIITIHKHKHRALRYIVNSSTATAITISIIPLLSFATGFHKKINISPPYFKTFAVTYINHIFTYMLLCSLLFALVTVLVLIIIGVMKRKLVGEGRER